MRRGGNVAISDRGMLLLLVVISAMIVVVCVCVDSVVDSIFIIALAGRVLDRS